MKFLICLFLLLAFLLPAPAQQSPVPIEKEPRHPLIFENQYVRVFDVLIPAGKTTLSHIHEHDGVGVRLTDARIRDEPQTGAPEEISAKRGEVSFAFRPSPLIHKVSNIGDTPFRNIFVEILPSAGVLTDAKPLADVAGYALALENNRVRMLRLVLAPGESTEVRTHSLRCLSVAVTKGNIIVETPGSKKTKTQRLKPGDTQWREVGTKYSLKNVGSAPFEVVDIELK